MRKVKPPDFENDWIFADCLVAKVELFLEDDEEGPQYKLFLCHPNGVSIDSIIVYVNRYYKEVKNMALGGASFNFFGDGIKIIMWQIDDQKCKVIFFEGEWMQLDSDEDFLISPLFSVSEDSENYYLYAAEINIFNKADRQDLKIEPIIINRKGLKPPA